DPLAAEPGVRLTLLRAGQPIPGDAALVILPGSKSTHADLAFLRAQGWDIDLAAHVRRDGHVLGLCGGFQMLGRMIRDPGGIEGPAGETPGLGLLELTTEMSADKRLAQVEGTHVATGEPIHGYEIHLGRSTGPDCARPFAVIGGQPAAPTSAAGRTMGSYLHGAFASDGFRRAFLSRLGAAPSRLDYDAEVEQALDALADHVEAHLDVGGLLALAR